MNSDLEDFSGFACVALCQAKVQFLNTAAPSIYMDLRLLSEFGALNPPLIITP
jgi:hypothetical protein